MHISTGVAFHRSVVLGIKEDLPIVDVKCLVILIPSVFASLVFTWKGLEIIVWDIQQNNTRSIRRRVYIFQTNPSIFWRITYLLITEKMLKRTPRSSYGFTTMDICRSFSMLLISMNVLRSFVLMRFEKGQCAVESHHLSYVQPSNLLEKIFSTSIPRSLTYHSCSFILLDLQCRE